MGVWPATLKHNLDVVLMLSKIWRVLLEVDHGPSLKEGVIRQSLSRGHGDTLIGVERAGEIIAISYAEDTSIEADILSNGKVPPGVGLNGVDLWYQVALQENALGDARVGDSSLQNVDGVIFEVVVEGTLAETVILSGVLDNWLLEEAAEVEDLAVVLEPFGGDAGH